MEPLMWLGRRVSPRKSVSDSARNSSSHLARALILPLPSFGKAHILFTHSDRTASLTPV